VNGHETKRYCCGEIEFDSVECFNDENKRIFLMETILHCADISNPVKSWDIGKVWADLVCEEFFQQGDRERVEGLEVSPMMDRAIVNLPNMQLGFMEYIVAPLFSGE
jgi:cAMP-specific phosphodiesterase 4